MWCATRVCVRELDHRVASKNNFGCAVVRTPLPHHDTFCIAPWSMHAGPMAHNSQAMSVLPSCLRTWFSCRRLASHAAICCAWRARFLWYMVTCAQHARARVHSFSCPASTPTCMPPTPGNNKCCQHVFSICCMTPASRMRQPGTAQAEHAYPVAIGKEVTPLMHRPLCPACRRQSSKSQPLRRMPGFVLP